jgi:hypothetical protein
LQIVKEKFKRKKYRECFFIPHTSLLLSHPSKWFKLIQNFNNSKFNFFLAFALYFVFKDDTIIKRIRGGWMLLCSFVNRFTGLNAFYLPNWIENQRTPIDDWLSLSFSNFSKCFRAFFMFISVAAEATQWKEKFK